LSSIVPRGTYFGKQLLYYYYSNELKLMDASLVSKQN
jgi:hypothetical protein